MSRTWLVSDTHWGHKNICVFTREDGSPLRPWDDPDVMDADMIERWNSVVSANDVVYHLGDVVINRRCLDTMDRLHGNKRLILGNHDIFDHSDYLRYFKRLHGSFKLADLLLTHIPVHVDSVPHWALANVHGHIHARVIDHPSFYNVSVENIDYTPIELEDLRARILARKAKYQLDNCKKTAIIESNLGESN